MAMMRGWRSPMDVSRNVHWCDDIHEAYEMKGRPDLSGRLWYFWSGLLILISDLDF
jgi:hypothetical protein